MTKLKKLNAIYSVKNAKNEVTHLIVPLNIYNNIMQEVTEYKTIQKKKQIKWVKVTPKI